VYTVAERRDAEQRACCSKSDILRREDGTGSLYLLVMDGSSTATGTGYLLGTPSGRPDFGWEIQERQAESAISRAMDTGTPEIIAAR